MAIPENAVTVNIQGVLDEAESLGMNPFTRLRQYQGVAGYRGFLAAGNAIRNYLADHEPKGGMDFRKEERWIDSKHKFTHFMWPKK